MKRSNDNQQRVLDFLRERSGEGLPPTVREICAATGIKSTSTVFSVLRSLEEQGLITRDGRSSRSIHVEGVGRHVQVPLVGTVTAGVPILAQENIEEYMPFPSDIARGRELFALRVSGMSMMNAGILDGDIIYAEKAQSAEQGEIVVALIEDEATVKRYFFENGRVRLQPENDDFQPIIGDNISVIGRVVASFRKY